jgi:hypothetical protein
VEKQIRPRKYLTSPYVIFMCVGKILVQMVEDILHILPDLLVSYPIIRIFTLDILLCLYKLKGHYHSPSAQLFVAF